MEKFKWCIGGKGVYIKWWAKVENKISDRKDEFKEGEEYKLIMEVYKIGVEFDEYGGFIYNVWGL